jgi:hypothetical protein
VGYECECIYYISQVSFSDLYYHMLGEVGEGYLSIKKILLGGRLVRIASIEALGCEEPGKL